MPPWRTVEDTRAEGKPVSLTTMASASSAAFLCCTSKSGGTYSASITGVSGSTLTKRIMPSDGPAIINAVATAGLARSGSARPIGTRILLYMAPSLSDLVFGHIAPPAGGPWVGRAADAAARGEADGLAAGRQWAAAPRRFRLARMEARPPRAF